MNKYMKEFLQRVKHILWLIFIPGDYVFMTEFKMDNFITIYNIKLNDGNLTATYSLYSGDLTPNAVAEVITGVGEHLTRKIIKDYKHATTDNK